MSKKNILDYITNHYLQSHDFNGVIVNQIPEYNVEELIELINENKIFILSEMDDINIFINRLNLYKTKEIQIKITKTDSECVAYPSKEHLKTITINEIKPFTKMLAEGNEQLQIIYFNVDVLELYVNNPIYKIYDHGYSGSIFVSNEETQSDTIHSEYIKNFGMAYPTIDKADSDRAIAVLLCDLSKLNYEAQCKWRGFMLPDQSYFRCNKNFINNLVYGEWTNGYWIFDAVLKEIEYINQLCNNMNIPKLFLKEYNRQEMELIGYRIILIPTLKNYYEFVSSLEKIIINNLNYKTFQKDAFCIKGVKREREDKSLKGSIDMLEEWINQNYKSPIPDTADAFKKDVIDVLKEIRQIRQIPAHKLYDNKHDKSVYKKQNELIMKLYMALKVIRIIFNRHPSNFEMVVPKELENEDEIVIY